MLRKLISAIIVLALSTFGFSAASPAQAAGTFTAPVTVPDGTPIGISIPMSDSTVINLWLESDENGGYIKSVLLKSDGTITEPSVVVAASTSTSLGYYFRDNGEWLITKDGTVALAWVETENNTSYAYIAFTKDGIEWSVPTQIFTPRQVTSNSMACMMQGCGYKINKLSIDSRGTFAVLASFFNYPTSTLLASTSVDGMNWGAVSTLESGSNLNSYRAPTIAALPGGGFAAVWNIGTSLKYSILVPTFPSYWQRSKVIETVNGLNDDLIFTQTDPTHFSLFFAPAGNTPTLKQQLFDLTSKTWGTSSTIITTPAGWYSSSIKFSMGKNWHGAIAFGTALDGVLESYAHLVEFTNSVPSPQQLLKTGTEQTMDVTALRVNFDDSITMVTRGDKRRANIITWKAGVQLGDVEIPTTVNTDIYNMMVAVSPSGNIFINSGSGSASYEGIVYRAASAPIPVGTLKLTGLAKTGQTVTSKIPTFTGVSNIGTTRIQWYSCTTKVAIVQATIPVTCALIAKATALKFKVTTKQKNKYLGVAVSNTNAVGTATLFSTLATKAK
jgi:hypothetical protein